MHNVVNFLFVYIMHPYRSINNTAFYKSLCAYRVGKNISTKRISSNTDISVDPQNPNREDITHLYKYVYVDWKGRKQRAMWTAEEMSTKPTDYKFPGSKEVKLISALGSTFINAQRIINFIAVRVVPVYIQLFRSI